MTPHKNHLHLIADDAAREHRKAAATWLIETAPDPIPDSPELLLVLDGCPGGLRPGDLAEVIDELVAEGKISRVQIGALTHLTRTIGEQAFRNVDDQRHRLEVQLDLETERQLLFRLAIVLELIVLLLFARQWMIDPEALTTLFR